MLGNYGFSISGSKLRTDDVVRLGVAQIGEGSVIDEKNPTYFSSNGYFIKLLPGNKEIKRFPGFFFTHCYDNMARVFLLRV